jgi:hypothetical protein
MIFDVHGKALISRIERRAFRHRPRQQHAIPLQPQVVVQVRRQVLLDTEEERARFLFRRLFAGGFRCFCEVAFLLIFLERHVDSF